MPQEGDLAHHPAVAFALIMVSAAGFITALINMRNVRQWLLRVAGRRASGVVDRIEVVTSSTGEVLRRPVVTFRTEDGTEVVSAAVMYRTSVPFAKGAEVVVSYARRRPGRIAVHGYDVRIREPVYAALGLLTAVVIGTVYFQL